MAVVLVIYAALRAALLPITIDEAFSYLFFVRAPVPAILSLDSFERLRSTLPGDMAANNHVLNSLLSKGSARIFGTSELALRLPNVGALAAYLLFSWLILRRIRPGWVGLSGFLAMALNPFVLDYFSLSRGYGLSLGLFMAGLYAVSESLRTSENRRVVECLGFFLIALGVLASYVLVDLFVAVGATWFVVRAIQISAEARETAARRPVRELVGEILPILAIAFALLAAVGPNLARLSRMGALWFGGNAGFWRDTVGSLVDGTLYLSSHAAAIRPFLIALIAGLAALVVLFAIPAIRRATVSPADAEAVAWTALLVLVVSSNVAEHAFLGARFRVGRTALFFLPIFVLALAATMGAMARSSSAGWRRSSRVAAVLAAAAIVQFAASANLRRFLFFEYDMDTPALLADLENAKSAISHPIRIRTEWRIAPALEFYRVTRNLGWFTWDTQAVDWTGFDYAYLFPAHSRELGAHGFRLVRSYPRSGNLLGAPPSPR